LADGLYIGMAAASARTQQLDAIADNLANAETPGYKAARPAFQSVLASAGVTDKVFAAAVGTGLDMTPGPAVDTGNPLDVLPENNAFLAVVTGQGQVAFTRNGELAVGADGRLASQGLPVIGTNGEPIVIPPETTARIQEDGTVIVDGRPVGQLAMFNLPPTVTKLAPSLYQPAPGSAALPVVDGRVRIGAIEMGNAPALDGVVNMIGAQRHFETAMQAIQTYRRMDDKANEMGKVR
jgi:flagellar basal-body rod protein FlgF